MDKSYDLQQLADQYAKSLTGETKLFEQFLIDYFQTSPGEAFKKLSNSSATVKTRQCAEDFNQNFLDQNLSKIQDELQGLNASPSARQVKLLQGFFRDYFDSGNFGMALDNVQKQIGQDPELRSDQAFQTFFKKIVEHVRPKQKERKEVNSQEDEAVFFKVRTGLRRRFEHKLTDHEVMKLMDTSLKKLYTSHLPDSEKGQIPVNVNHEVESIYKQKQLPLALQLAYTDTLKRSEKTTVELRELDNNITSVKKLTAQGVKFNFTDVDLQNSAKSQSALPVQKTDTEKVEIVRDLIIDLQTQPISDAFKSAIRKTTEYGDKELLKVLEKNFAASNVNKTIDGQASMLLDTYKLYLTVDTSLYKDDVRSETQNLANGIKAEPVKLALDELQKKGDAMSTAAAYNRFFQKAIHSIPQKELNKYRTTTVADEVEAIAKKTSIRVDIENARVPPQPGQDKPTDKGLEAFLN